jgi:nitric oxide reductase subunit C
VRPSRKAGLVLALVAAFGARTALVYTDEQSDPLNPLALQGRRLWHRHACQVCHQLWGQGGFLGPDLTNAGRSLDSVRLATLLTSGSRQMPAFHLSPAEITAVRAYLVALDRPERGRGQLRLGESEGSPWARFGRAASELLSGPAASAARRGWETFSRRPCGACHYPLGAGAGGAPDLSGAPARLGPDSLRSVLRSGRPERGMPAPFPALAPGSSRRSPRSSSGSRSGETP